jgi:acetylornithine deacetylase
MPVSFGTDIPRLKGSHKRYLYGPGSILDAHTDNEHVKIPDLIECVAVYKRLLLMCLEAKS